MSQYHVVEPGAFHTEPKMPRFHDVWNPNHKSSMWGGQKQQEKLSTNKIKELKLLGVEWDKDSRTGKPYDVKTPFHTAVGHFEDIRNINRQSGKKKEHPIVWRIQITSEPLGSKFLNKKEKLADNDNTTTEQNPDTDRADKKDSGKVERVPGEDSEPVKAMKKLKEEKEKEIALLAEKEADDKRRKDQDSRVRDAAREAAREQTFLREHRDVLDDAQYRRNRTHEVGHASQQAYKPLQRSRPRGANGPGTTVRTVTYQNPPEVDDFYDAAGDF